jgi:hypothetical protein
MLIFVCGDHLIWENYCDTGLLLQKSFGLLRRTVLRDIIA